MQWLRERSSFIVGSDRWMGSAQNSSSQNGYGSSQEAGMPSPAPPRSLSKQKSLPNLDPAEVMHYDPLTGLRVRSPKKDDNLDQAVHTLEENTKVEKGGKEKIYPEIYHDSGEEKIVSAEEVLVIIPDCLAHLIDNEQSVLLASGEFSLVKLSQNGAGVAMFARVGNELQWPLVRDEPTTKLDPQHYVFTLRITESDGETKDSEKETLNYGVTFKVDGNKPALEKLDKLLEQYSYFSAPTMLQASEEDLKKLDTVEQKSKEMATSSELPIPGKPVPTEAITETKPSADVAAAYWTTIAPNVDDYNHSLARAIASGTGQIIRGIFWLSDTTVSNLDRGGKFVKRVSGTYSKPSEISPRTMRNIRRVKRVTKMSEKVAKGVLTGVVSVTGFFTTTLVNSRVGKKFFKMLPGEVALASLEGFGKIFDAVEVAGTNVLNTTSVVTTGAVSHRFGDQAGEFAHEGLATAGHLFSAAWAISKLRNAINPKNALKPTAVLRTAAKAAAKDAKA